MTIKKFYDVSVDGSGGSGEGSEAKTDVSSLPAAAALAQFGKKSDGNSMVEPLEDIKKVETEQTDDSKKAATATTDETVGKSDKLSKTEPLEKGGGSKENQQTVENTAPHDLEEVLKQNQPERILKALGFDDEKISFVSEIKDIDPKVVGIINAYKNGELGEYLSELNKDYSKLSAEEVMRYQLKQEYPKATPKQLEALFRSEVLEKYKIDPDYYTEEEVEYGKDLLEAKADKYREQLIANQDKNLLPKSPEKTNQVDSAKEYLDMYTKEISENSYTKDIVANKKITIGDGDSKFSFPVDPDMLIKNLTDAQTWVNSMYDKVKGDDGNYVSVPKIQHQLLVATVAQYGTKFLDAYALHFKGLGGKEVIEPITNARPPEGSATSRSETMPQSIAALMAKSGVRKSGGM